MPIDLRNVKGGGLHYVSDFTSSETQIWRGGLRNLSANHESLIKGTKNSPKDYHDKIDYERGAIIHSRSPSNQFFNFHYLFGGFRKYFVERWFINHYYRRNLRKTWLPFMLFYTFCCYHMRLYDNAAHDFFYFSD